MRRTFGIVLVGLGVFLLTMAGLARFYVYEQLAVAPADQDSTSQLFGADATVFDIGSMEEITTDLYTTAVTVGDVEAAEEAGGDTLVWTIATSTEDTEGVVRSRSIDRVAFDARTGAAVNCCGEYYSTVEGEEDPVEHEGQVFKFPFGTEKKTYDWWDSTLLETVPIEFEEVEDVEGVETYRFSHQIDPTATGTVELPAELLGETGDEALTADRMYSNTRTLWVEPHTGVVIKRQEEQNNTVRYDGVDRITTTAVTTGFTEADVKANAEEYGDLGRLLNLVKNVGPLVALILGLTLVGIGLALLLAGRRRDDDDHVDEVDRRPVATGAAAHRG